MSRIVSLITTLALAYAVVCLLAFLTQSAMLFYPQPNSPRAVASLEGHAWQAHSEDGALNGWLIPAERAERAPLVLYFGGNAEDLAVSACRSARDANYLYVNYRGYGATPGRPSARALKADALAIYDAAIEMVEHDGRVVAMGRSLGSGVAVYLAAHRQVAAMVLITPFDSLVNVARGHFPWLPVRWLLRHRFDSDRLAPVIRAPVLILIADRDIVVPARHGLALAEVWGGAAEVVRFSEAGHNDIDQAPGFANAVNRFLARLPIDRSH